MAAQTFRLVFQGKIAPDQDLDQVKTRMQQLFKKDAATIEKLFSGKKIPLKQGLNQSQAIQYREKLRALGIVCEMESQGSIQKPAANAAKPNRSNTTAHSASANKPLKFADIDKAFTDHLPRFEPSFAYKAGIVGVGIIMVLLPIVYLALIMVVGYGVLHHSIVNTGWMGSFGYKLGTVAYITPIIVGVTIILFMLKPLFARPVDEPKTTNVDPLQEPLFIHFVSKVALAVGAPRPKQILIDCDVNASASFHRGLFGFISNELVLTIGMPLIAGLNARQLAGVLAHEFGHFSQGAGMRFHYLTYKINSWLFKAVYTRDTWDQKLDNAAAEAPGWLHIILNVARGGVWASRKILTVFLMTGHAVSSYMLRQMEFDADRYEIYLAGSEQFRDTTLQFQKLGAAYQVSHDHLAKAWEEKKLVNDFPSLIAHNAEQLSPQASKALLKQMEQDKTGVYDSHPTDKQRIEKALQEGANGVFNLNCEGRELLKTFTYLAKRVTVHHYANDLGLEFEKDKLVDVEQVVKITRDHEHQQEAYHDYFKEMAPVFRFPLSVNIFDTSNLDWDKLLEQYQEVNDRIANEAVTRNRLMSQVNKAYRTYQIFDTIDLLKQGGLVMLPEWFDLNDELYNKHKAQLEKAEQTWQQFMQQLKPMFELNDQRLSIALTLLNHPRLIERNREHAHHLKMRNRLSLLINNFKRNTETILNFESRKFRLMSFLSCARAIGQKAPQVQEVTERLMEEYKQAFSQLSSCLHRLDYPFVGDGEHETVAGHLETLLPKRTQCGSELEYYLSSGNVIEEKLEVVYERVMSGLAAVALTVDCLLPTLDQEPENQTQQQLAVGENATQGNTALAQSNPAFSSADSSTQDKTEKPSDSAMAFYEMAVMGSSSAKNPIMPEDMNPGATQSDGASSAPDKDQSATEAIKNLVGETSQNTQSPQGAKPASTNKDRNAGAGSVKEPALSVANESKPVESSPRAKVGAAATNENNVDSNNDKPKPVEKQAAEIKAVELSPETKADAAGTISNKTNVDSDNVTLAEHQPASNALPAEPKTPKPAPTSENRLQLATDALREQANKTKAAISAAAAARKKDDTAPNESNEVVSQSVAGSEPAIGSLSAELKSDVTAGKHDQQQQGDSAPLQANKASNVELTLVPDAGPSQTSGTDNAASHQDQDQSQSSGTSESSADKQTATEPHAASQHSSNDAMAQSIDHLKQTINNLSLEPRDDSPVTDSESVTETLT
ncbi:MAG: M48 family metalloprotease, partial [Gammaproteobacteria bacterium]